MVRNYRSCDLNFHRHQEAGVSSVMAEVTGHSDSAFRSPASTTPTFGCGTFLTRTPVRIEFRCMWLDGGNVPSVVEPEPQRQSKGDLRMAPRGSGPMVVDAASNCPCAA